MLFAWVDVLCIVVETRDTRQAPELRANFFVYGAERQELFLLKQVLDCKQSKTVSSTRFEGVSHTRASRRMWNSNLGRAERSSL
jgi:hypothetical protein